MTKISVLLLFLAYLQCASPSVDETTFQVSGELSKRLSSEPHSLRSSDLAIELKHEFREFGRYHCHVYSVFEGALHFRELVATDEGYLYVIRNRNLNDDELSATIKYVIEGGIIPARSIGGPDRMVDNILVYIKVNELVMRKSWADLYPHDIDKEAYLGLLLQFEQLANQRWDAVESSVLSATSETARNIRIGKQVYASES
ncbi:MAG: hypothetical protein HRF49_03890 [bacterium]|jgi:hypothetical protein